MELDLPHRVERTRVFWRCHQDLLQGLVSICIAAQAGVHQPEVEAGVEVLGPQRQGALVFVRSVAQPTLLAVHRRFVAPRWRVCRVQGQGRGKRGVGFVVAAQLQMHIAQGDEPFRLIGFEGHGHFVELDRFFGLAQGQVDPAQRSQHLARLRMALPRFPVHLKGVRVALLPQQSAPDQQWILNRLRPELSRRRRLHYRLNGRNFRLGFAAGYQCDAQCE